MKRIYFQLRATALLAFFALVTHYLMAQNEVARDNTINASCNLFLWIPDESFGYSPLTQVGFAYQRSIHDLVIQGSFSFWNGSFLREIEWAVGHWPKDTSEIGSLATRSDYHFADITACYRLSFLKHFNLTTGIGPSLTWGHNYYFTYIFFNPGLGDVVVAADDLRSEQKLGIAGVSSLNYNFLHDRLNVGFNYNLRIYPNYYRQSDAGIHVGINF